MRPANRGDGGAVRREDAAQQVLGVMSDRDAGRLIAVAAGLTLAALAGELALIGHVELTFDEAYYVLWSRHLVWGYYDHPPMIAAWIRASTALFGPDEFGVRALGVIVFAAMPALVGMTGARLYGSARAGAFAACVWLTMPLVAGAVLATPDPPLVAFVTLAFCGLVEVWRGRGVGWALIGAALGLAALAKIDAAFFAAGVALAVVATPSLRRWLRSPAPYAAAALTLAICAPFLIWNAQHDWLTFGRQLSRVPAHRFAPSYLLEGVVALAGLANPFFFVIALAALRPAFRRGGGPALEAMRLPVLFGAPMTLYFAFHALHDRVEGNWAGPLYPLIAVVVGEAAARGPLWTRRAAWVGVAVGAAAIAAVYLHAATLWPTLGAKDPLARFGGWRELAISVDAEARAEGAAFVLARDYAAVSLLTYYGDGATPVLQSEEAARWRFRPPPAPNLFDAPGIAVAYVGADYPDLLRSRFRTVEWLERLPRKLGGVEVAAVDLYRVTDPIAPPIAPR